MAAGSVVVALDTQVRDADGSVGTVEGAAAMVDFGAAWRLLVVVEGDLVEDGYERRWLGGCVRFGDFMTGWRGYAWCVGVSAGGGRWWWGAAMFHGQVKGVGR